MFFFPPKLFFLSDEVTLKNKLKHCVPQYGDYEPEQFLFSWGRFLYGSVSLCEWSSIALLTVVISCIFSLDSTDFQREAGSRLTISESGWSPWHSATHIGEQEFRSFSRSLQIPGYIIGNRAAGPAVESDSPSNSDRLHCGTLSHDDVSAGPWE